MKQFIILLFFSCLIASYCPAQVIQSDEPDKHTGVIPPRQALLVAVTFATDDTCNLTINNKDYKEVAKNKIVKLPLGNYRLFFESLETGKIIRDRSFRLTREMVTGGKYTYPVIFKQQD